MKHRRWLITLATLILVVTAFALVVFQPDPSNTHEPAWLRNTKPEEWAISYLEEPSGSATHSPMVHAWWDRYPKLTHAEAIRLLKSELTVDDGWKLESISDDYLQWRRTESDAFYIIEVGVHKGGPYVHSEIYRPLTWPERTSRSFRAALGLPVMDHGSSESK